MADVGEMLERGVGVAVALERDGLALVPVEEDSILERAGVAGAEDLQALLGQALPFGELAGVEFNWAMPFDFVQG